MRNVKASIMTWLAVSAFLPLAGCGPTLEVGEDARIRVTPPRQITFSRVTVGETRALPFVMTSVGRDTLEVHRIEWDGADSVRLQTEGDAFPRRLDSQASLPVSVSFTPTGANPAPDGTIRIYSNDLDSPVYELDVRAQQLAPQIHVVPSAQERLIIGQTDVGESVTKTIVVSNVGDLPLNLNEIKLGASADFRYSVENNRRIPTKIAADSSDYISVNVTFSPKKIGAQEASISFVSDDPAHPVYTVPIVANSDAPCLKISPSIVEFSPAVSVGSSREEKVILESCGDVPLIISDVIKNSGENVFTHAVEGLGKPISNGEHITLTITYTPTVEGTNQAQYIIINNDPLQANVQLSAMGSASTNQCPAARARARLSSSSTWSKNLDLAPLDTVILDGSESLDPESSELEYFWSIKSAPRDSTAGIAQDGAKGSFFLDLAGEYELCLDVQDSAGMMSCNTDCVKVTATPRETIHIQLVWHTPADTIIGDNDGSDLDLHFLTLPGGTWGDTGNPQLNNGTDVFFLNREPVWPVSQGVERPSLDIDDMNGEGPENINLDAPEPCRWYAIGVNYYADKAFGPSYATVRAYINGKILFEKANISLLQTGVFKQLAWMFWDGSAAHFYESDFAAGTDTEWRGKSPAVPDDIMNRARESSPQCFRK